MTAPATERAYRTDWRHFTAWCDANGVPALPASPETVAIYLSSHSPALSLSTLSRRRIVIGQHHASNDLADPVRHPVAIAAWRRIREADTRPTPRKAPTRAHDLRLMLDALKPTIKGDRDRAIILVGFSTGMRRSELVALDVADLEALDLPSADDPHHDANHARSSWLEASGIRSGPAFRPIDRHGNVSTDRLSDRAVAQVVKGAAEGAGLNPDRYAGHSLRAGLITSAAEAGVNLHAISDAMGLRAPAVSNNVRGPVATSALAAAVGL